MRDIFDFLGEWADQHELKVITDTSYGLNVDADDTADAGDENDKKILFLNISQNGTYEASNLGRFLTITYNYEIGLFKKCLKETEGISYYNDSKELVELANQLFVDLHKVYEITTGTFENAVDQLDENEVAVKMNFSIVDYITLC